VVIMELGQRLKSLREEKDLSQLELGERLNISNSTLSLYESGKRQPDYKTLQRIADFYGVSIDYLFGRTNTKKPPEKAFESALSDSPELLEFWKELSKRDDLQLMFKQARKLSPESIRKVVEVIKLIEDKEAEE